MSLTIWPTKKEKKTDSCARCVSTTGEQMRESYKTSDVALLRWWGCMDLEQSNCCQSIFLQEVQTSPLIPRACGWSAEQLVKSYHKKGLFALTLLHLQDCLALDSTGYRSTAYLLHKLKYTHLPMNSPPASCRVLWNSSSTHTSTVHWVFPKERKSWLQYV